MARHPADCARCGYTRNAHDHSYYGICEAFVADPRAALADATVAPEELAEVAALYRAGQERRHCIPEPDPRDAEIARLRAYVAEVSAVIGSEHYGNMAAMVEAYREQRAEIERLRTEVARVTRERDEARSHSADVSQRLAVAEVARDAYKHQRDEARAERDADALRALDGGADD